MGVLDDLVAVPPPGLGPDDEALADEFGDDLLDGPLGDADPLGEVADPGLRIAGDRDEHVPVVRQEGPSVVTGHGGRIGERRFRKQEDMVEQGDTARWGASLDDLLQADVALLTGLHRDSLVERGAGRIAELMASLSDAGDAAMDIVGQLDVADAAALAQALTVHFHLVNLAEERHQSRLHRRRQDGDDGPGWPAASGLGADALERLERLRIHPVLTAHPTEARRRAVTASLSRIAEHLDAYDDPRNGALQRGFARRRMLEEIDILGRTAQLRRTAPAPTDEVRTVMGVFDQTLFRAVPAVYRAVEAAVPGTDAGRQPSPVPAFLRFGSWIGGDRDGNPFVTAEVTREAVAIQAEHVLRALGVATERIARTLTMSEQTTPPSAALRDALALAAVTAPDTVAAIVRSSPGEPHRQHLLFAAARLGATLRGSLDLGYREPAEFVHDLRLVQDSLSAAGDARAAHGELQHLLWQAETFGFHLAELEVRQHSAVHAAALEELLDQLDDDPGAPGSPERLAVLDRFAVHGWPEQVRPLTEATGEVLDTFRLMGWLQQRWGRRCCGRYVVSFSQSAEHLVAVRALARLAVGERPLNLDVVPLFETGADLRAAGATLSAWMDLASTRAWLEDRDRQVEVMVGYSDSAKDIGPAAATLTLYRTQAELVRWAGRAGVQLTIFHGRGGSLGRGGGPLHRAVLAQPPGSLNERLKVTEQGEVIFARYADVTLAQAHLERLASAVLVAGTPQVTRHNTAAEHRFAGLAATVEQASREAWLALVRTPGFPDVLAASSPLEELGQLRLGSRPARRSGAATGRDLSDFRAIPWVFAWSQVRANVPGWFGLGSGLAAVGDVDELRAAYRDWPLFASLVDIAEMSLAKANPRLAAQFLALGGRPDVTDRVLEEYERTRHLVLETLGQSDLLEGKPELRHRLALRAPSIDALSHIQLRALRVLRSSAGSTAGDGHDWSEVLLLTVNGAAAGLQNTG